MPQFYLTKALWRCTKKYVARYSLPGVFSYPVRALEKLHTTSKPLELMLALMPVVPEGGVVLDPFCGGGTTALAAKMTGRGCISMELSADYARIAAECWQAV